MPHSYGPCEFAGCGRRQRHPMKLCDAHRRMKLRGDELRPLRRYERAKSKTCAGPRCDRLVDSHGLCKVHVGQQRRTGQTWAIGERSGRQRERWKTMPAAERERRLAGLRAGRRAAYSEQWTQRQSDAQRTTGAAKRRAQLVEQRRDCRCCGESFIPASWRQLFCVADCRTLASRLRRHGITVDQYRELLAEQGGACALCRQARRGFAKGADLHIDHDHATGRVRGLLCGDCNTALGRFGDDPGKLRRAAEYLERSR